MFALLFFSSYKESSKESNMSNWESSQPTLANSMLVISSSPRLTTGGLAGSTMTGWLKLSMNSPVSCFPVQRPTCSFRKDFASLLFFRFTWLGECFLILRLFFRPSSKTLMSSLQNPPFPGSSFDLGILTKHLLRDKLCRIEFWNWSKENKFLAKFHVCCLMRVSLKEWHILLVFLSLLILWNCLKIFHFSATE